MTLMSGLLVPSILASSRIIHWLNLDANNLIKIKVNGMSSLQVESTWYVFFAIEFKVNLLKKNVFCLLD